MKKTSTKSSSSDVHTTHKSSSTWGQVLHFHFPIHLQLHLNLLILDIFNVHLHQIFS
ncbi:hypothetical protein DEO72_LG3g836 [Vigna unguiculata]|uniref:Uncharacterized protein n=1 Tax=Vigna unguiculata TaxID=3917 RepID=A0A4D6LDA1_VIGUN|nr:hypothetical protein DEO72_LG3g836 [Vigna unguiculata]